MTEFFEDFYEKNPDELKGLDLMDIETGDELIDKWEREIEQGFVPNILEDLTPEEGGRLRKWSKRVYELKQERGMIGIDDPQSVLGTENTYREDF